MKVAVAVHGRFHGFDLARELHAHGRLARLCTTYPGLAVRRFLPADVPIATIPWLEGLRRLHGHFGGPSPHMFIGRTFARFVGRTLTPGTDVLVGWSGATLEAIKPARRLGIKVVLERGSSHIAHQAQVLAEEYARFGQAAVAVDPAMIAREEAEYAQADAIAVPTSFAAGTFIARSIPAERLVVNPYGVDLSRYQPAPRPEGRPRLVFVGRVGLRKGIPYLLDAARRLPGMDVHLIGPVEAGMETILGQAPANVTVRGPLPGAALPAEYARGHVFCLPSLEEGLPLTLLQAMASGLPVVATPETGAADVVTPGQEGWIVPARDGAGLAEAVKAILPYAAAMGERARARVVAGHGWADYGLRARESYGRLGGTP